MAVMVAWIGLEARGRKDIGMRHVPAMNDRPPCRPHARSRRFAPAFNAAARANARAMPRLV